MSSHRIPVQLRWVDLDAQGHVNNAVVVDYLQQARVSWLMAGANAHLLGNALMVVSHQVEYLGPINFAVAEIEVELSVGRVGAAQFHLGYRVFQDGEIRANARSTMCLFDYAAQRPRRMTPAERAWFVEQSQPLPSLRSLGRWHVAESAATTNLIVRWSDLDPYGHVNNVRVFDFFAEGRIRLNPDSDQISRMELAKDAGITWMVARQDVDYLGQIGLASQPYQVRTAIARLGRTSVTLVAEIVDPAQLSVLARARTVLVSGDAAGRPIPLPESMYRAAAKWPAESD